MKLGIFVESNEQLGLMYKSYKDIPARVKSFMDFINDVVDYALHKGIPDKDIKSELKKFKEDVKTNMIKPSEVNISTLDDMVPKIKKAKEEVNELLKYLGDIRKKFRFGDNIVKGIIIKPKIYRNTVDENELASVNAYMVATSNALDWIEKVVIDLMNMCDQDANLASVMNSLYFRECHESSDFMEEFDIINMEDIINNEI